MRNVFCRLAHQLEKEGRGRKLRSRIAGKRCGRFAAILITVSYCACVREHLYVIVIVAETPDPGIPGRS